MNQDDISVVSGSQIHLEGSMKELLEKILTYLEKFISTKEELEEIENKLNDYDNLESLVEIIKKMFEILQQKIENKLKLFENGEGISEEYEQLEKILQKHESEIRNHIRLEQQLKLYAESLQQKFEDSEKSRTELLESTKQLINGVKRDNHVLTEELSKMKDENIRIMKQLKKYEENEKVLNEQVSNLPYLQEKVSTLERIISDTRSSQSIHSRSTSKQGSYQQVNVEFDIKKTKKAETPPVNYNINSPIKLEQKRIPTPNQISKSGKSDYVTVKIEIGEKNKQQLQPQFQPKSDFKNSYQKFYNQVKHAKEESFRNVNKDIRNIYRQVSISQHHNQSTSANRSSIKDTRDSIKNINNHQNSIQTHSHNNSYVQTSSSSKNFPHHKRAKSQGANKIRTISQQNEFNDGHVGSLGNSINIMNMQNTAGVIGYKMGGLQNSQSSLQN